MVYQGERPMAHDNKLLGHFQLTGIKPARRGQPRIEVTFNIDVNGIVKVTAKDLDTQQSQDITISGSNGLSKSDIDRMIKEAEENKAADEKRKNEAEVMNKAQTYVDQINATLTEQGDKMTPEQKEQLKGIDVMLMPVGGFFTMEPEDVHTLVAELQPRMLVPMHYKGKGFGYDVIASLDKYTALCNDVIRLEKSSLSLPEDDAKGTVVLMPPLG